MAKVTDRKNVSVENFDRFLGKPANAEFLEATVVLNGMSEYGVREMWEAAFKRRSPPDAKVWILKLGVQYHALRRGQIRVQGDCSPKVARRYEMAKALDHAGLRRESDFLVGDYELEENERARGDAMVKSKEKRVVPDRRAKRVTAGRVLIGVLGMDDVPADAEIVERVRTETGSDKFDLRQLAWYKWKYRQGRLKGQDGKGHTISQNGHEKKKEAVARKKK